MIIYAIASLTPAALLAAACLLGGNWPVLAVLSITVVVFFLDKLGRVIPVQEADGRWLSYTLAAAHFVLLLLGVWSLGAAPYLSGGDKLLIFFGLGLFFGQISNSNAHELIHARGRLPRRIGAAVYISLLHGHHVSAHLRVHHVYAATDDDPNSARAGEGFYAYAARVFRQEFGAGLLAETAHRARASGDLKTLSHPYLSYVAGGALTLAISFVIAGIHGCDRAACHRGICPVAVAAVRLCAALRVAPPVPGKMGEPNLSDRNIAGTRPRGIPQR